MVSAAKKMKNKNEWMNIEPNGVPVEEWKVLGNFGIRLLTKCFNKVNLYNFIKVLDKRKIPEV